MYTTDTCSTGTTTAPSAAVLLQQALVQDRTTQQFSDCAVFVEDGEFQCHRIVLAAMSGFFRSLFSSGMTEAINRKVNLQGLSSDVFADVLAWIYEGKFILNQRNVFDVLAAADLLDIQGLLSDCKVFLSQNISVDNCVTVFHISQKYVECRSLYNVAKSIILRNFDTISASEDFYRFKREDIKTLVSDQALITRSEDLVIDGILRWAHCASPDDWQSCVTGSAESGGIILSPAKDLKTTENGTCVDTEGSQTMENGTDPPTDVSFKHDTSVAGTSGEKEEEQESYEQGVHRVGDLLEATRYLLISGKCLQQTLARDPLVQGDTSCHAILQDITRYKAQLDCHQDSCLSAACHRSSGGLRNVVLTSNFYEILYLNFFGWIKVKSGSLTEIINSIVYYNNSLFICDEYTNVHVLTHNLSTCSPVTSTRTGELRAVAMMPIGNELVSVCKDDEGVYSIECVSAQAQEAAWKRVGKLRTSGKTVASITTIGTKLVVFWKQIGQETLSVECFHLVRGKSFLLPDQLGPASGLVTFKYGDEAFALQDNGTLMRITSLEEEPFIVLKYELCLWGFQRAISGAILDKGNLLVFTPSGKPDSPTKFPVVAPGGKPDAQTEATPVLNEVFKKVIFKNAPHPNTGFIHAVLP